MIATMNLSSVRLLLVAAFAGFSGTLAFTPAAQAGAIGASANWCHCGVDMEENGGPVMTGTVETFAIFYGDFASANVGYSVTAQDVVSNWLSDLNGTSYLNIASTYTAAPNGPVSTDVTFNGSYEVDDYLGPSLHDINIWQIVQDTKDGGYLPTVANAIYFVFTAPGITEDSESIGACGWHSSVHSASTVYSWISSKQTCSDFAEESPSGNPVGDAFTESGSHELFEALTDPYVDYEIAYADPSKSSQGEVADLCYGSEFVGDLHGDHFGLPAIWTILDPSHPWAGTCAQGFVSDTVAAPEPASGALMLSGIGAFLGWRSRRRASRRRSGFVA
jgi:hypothetical protein